ncbi:hypothetical protein [Thalassolituus alkanivorans]|uniref:hypothetical protein n=1 Tax=Thalassolituus alkanivorans TaxID=2881055 RepID=UPI001E4BFDBE|nr:hypothetical protein [Thalassolituus alkanivorans]MCB2386852.1 hypothetical protein [Thalassolituus alkanivorans]MCB2425011.1 hypothetical protein [Thalassolituus alkanivorans]
MLDKLNEVISKYVNPLISKSKWALEKERASGLGALKEYSCENVYIRIVNDRGIFDMEIGSKYNQEQLRCVSFFKDWQSPPKRGKSNLSIEQQCHFLNENWESLNALLSQKEAHKTIGAVDEYLHSR